MEWHRRINLMCDLLAYREVPEMDKGKECNFHTNYKVLSYGLYRVNTGQECVAD